MTDLCEHFSGPKGGRFIKPFLKSEKILKMCGVLSNRGFLFWAIDGRDVSPALRCLESTLSKRVFSFPSFLLHQSSNNIIKQRSAGIQRTLPLVFLHSVFFSLIWERIPDVREFSNSWMYSKWRVKLLSTRPTYYDPIDTICNKWVLSEKNFNFRFF